MNDATNERLAACAERELKWRQRVYPNRVLTRRMSQAKADEEIAMMRAIVEHFRRLAADDAAKELLL